MPTGNYRAVYDFELFPYALGDVLTWNVRTAVEAEEARCSNVDAYICIDPQRPSSIYQRELVNSENCALYFNELSGAFGTHPILRNIFQFGSRDDLLAHLREDVRGNPVNEKALSDYESVLAKSDDRAHLDQHFMKYIFSHQRLNAFAERHGRIPQLIASRGCVPDVQGIIANVFGEKRIVVIHPRLRSLDYGLAGEETYYRDSSFLEWYEFVRTAGTRHPEVQFVVVGRLQEKPVELLRLPNVTSLRTMGFGLGHELTLMLQADFFLGASSGFAAMANFSALPYFITHMTKESCSAYDIPAGSPRLPFASEDQLLIYEPETAPMLMRLLEQGLARPARPRPSIQPRNTMIDVRAFRQEQGKRLYPGASTTRFFLDDVQADQETAFLLWPKLQQARAVALAGEPVEAAVLADRIINNLPRLAARLAELDRPSEPGPSVRPEQEVKPSQPAPKVAGPSLKTRIKRRIKDDLRKWNSSALPGFLRGGVVHAVARRAKSLIIPSSHRHSGPLVGNSRTVGTLEDMYELDATLVLTGWAIDTESYLPAPHVAALLGDKLLAIADPGMPRDDIAAGHGYYYRNCGFKLVLSSQHIEKIKQARFYAIMHNGKKLELVRAPQLFQSSADAADSGSA